MSAHLLLLIAALLGLFASRAPASDSPFAPTAEVAGAELALRGSDLFTWYGFEVYWAALYVASDTAESALLNAEVSRQLSLHYQRRITAANIRKATQKTLERNPAANVKALQARFDKLYSYYRDVKKGDQYDIVYVPDKGTTVRFNGEDLGTIEGADFAEALFGIWLSDHPIDDDLRNALKGGSK